MKYMKEKKRKKSSWWFNGRTGTNYDYLLGMKLWSLTYERVQNLTNQHDRKKEELEELLALSEKDLWIRDLDNFEKVYNTYVNF